MALNYEKMDINDIMDWCEENNQLEWLENLLSKKVKVKRHTERVPKLDKDGNIALNKKGYPIYIVDKKSPVEVVEQNISFMEVKKAFIEKFELEHIKPAKKDKAPTMLDKLKARKAKSNK
jgi:hypothetical protein